MEEVTVATRKGLQTAYLDTSQRAVPPQAWKAPRS